MGGSRGLMGPEAFAQLRAMVDKLLDKKVDDTAEGVSAALNRLTTGSDTPSDRTTTSASTPAVGRPRPRTTAAP